MNTNLASLKHTKYSLPHGGKVILLDTGAIIDAEAEAMLQALHSRSAKGIEDHLLILEERGAEKFMNSFYVGYGHKSIGDCGSTTVFIEGVSMLVAKAIQDSQLYCGQESSTRYIDFAEQEFRDPIGTSDSFDVLEEWRKFYVESQEQVRGHLRERYPRKDGEEEAVYEKAIAARAFDILRGFLPAGATTNLAWHTNLRQAADKLVLLRNHPLQEVRDVADGIQSVLMARHPSSFGHKKYSESEMYHNEMMQLYNYFEGDNCSTFTGDHLFVIDSLSLSLIKKYRIALENRPQKTELPKILSECGTIQFSFLLDFGSFRDIQRHRAVTQQMPLLGMQYGFESWYLDELPSAVKEDAVKLLDWQRGDIERMISLGITTPHEAQYYVPMGYRTPNRVTGGLPAIVYLIELRATRFVHPTLCRRAQEMAKDLTALLTQHGCNIALHLDPEPGRFDVKRGTHDIQLKS